MPVWVLILDYIMGMIMWTLIGRTAMSIFQREDSNFFFMKMFVKFTNPIIKPFGILTPSFIIRPLVPLYVAWFFYNYFLNKLKSACVNSLSKGNESIPITE